MFALIGSSVISAGESFRLEYSNSDNLRSNGYYSSADHNIDWLARVTIRKTNGYSNSLQRNRLLRVFSLAGIIVITVYLVGANLKIIKNNNIPVIKNLVLLKLRI